MRPTITLCLIAKNEENNIPNLFDSIRGCFDEIHFTDTGSTDNTIEVAKEWAQRIETPIKIKNFTWIDDFAAARNESIKDVKTDFWMWLDLDDVLTDAKNFIQWRNYAMEFCDYWLATYDYAVNEKGESICTFSRERVFRSNKGFKWKHFIHEGCITDNMAAIIPSHATSWKVTHRRSAEDLMKDKNRNLNAFKKHGVDNLDSRMLFYYGKELYEAKNPIEAFSVLTKAAVKEDLQLHDRTLCMQYLLLSARDCNQFDRVIELGLQAIHIAPLRAEFYNLIGEAYIAKGNLAEAGAYFSAAKACPNPQRLSPIGGAIFVAHSMYEEVPGKNLAKVYANIGKLKEAKEELVQVVDKYPHDNESKVMLAELNNTLNDINFENADIETEDIVFSTAPQQSGPYEWDEKIAQEKGMGGSETACIEMAKWLKRFTGRRVIVFNNRHGSYTSESGVEYRPNVELPKYFNKHLPKLHIAWRHNIKVTNAPTYLWCHDLVTPTVESAQNFDKILCLSNFHKNYVMATQGVPDDKIIVTRNGIFPERYLKTSEKNPNKLVWMSSPDRGLEQAMLVCDKVREEHPEVELHVFYGLDNLYKYGMKALADKLKAMMDERPWVKYHGFTQQDEMTKMVRDAAVWVHPCNFIETFCITALETLAAKIYPVTRRLGALGDTLGKYHENGMATLLDHACGTPSEIGAYAFEVCQAIEQKKWEKIEFNAEDHGWANVAKEWIDLFDLQKKSAPVSRSYQAEASL